MTNQATPIQSDPAQPAMMPAKHQDHISRAAQLAQKLIEFADGINGEIDQIKRQYTGKPDFKTAITADAIATVNSFAANGLTPDVLAAGENALAAFRDWVDQYYDDLDVLAEVDR